MRKASVFLKREKRGEVPSQTTVCIINESHTSAQWPLEMSSHERCPLQRPSKAGLGVKEPSTKKHVGRDLFSMT